MTRARAIVVVALVAFFSGGCALKEEHKESKPTSTQQGGQQGHGLVVVNLDGSDANKTPDHTITVPKVAVAQQAKGNEDTGGKDETPAGVPQAQLEAGQEQQKRLALKDLVPLNLPFAAPSQPGCRTSFVRNYSSRNGVAPHVIVIHWTGSANTGTWSDVNAIAAWFNQSRAQASSNYTIDSGGRCIYLVPEQQKAWTQAAANPISLSIEFVHPGGPNEPFCPGACRKKAGLVIAAMAKRWGIPLQHGLVRNCVLVKPGVIDHKSLGACGGGHPDVGGFSLDPLIAAAKAVAGAATHRYKPTAVDRRTCAKLNWWRHAGRPHGKPEHRAVRRRKALAHRGVVCTRHGPLRTK